MWNFWHFMCQMTATITKRAFRAFILYNEIW